MSLVTFITLLVNIRIHTFPTCHFGQLHHRLLITVTEHPLYLVTSALFQSRQTRSRNPFSSSKLCSPLVPCSFRPFRNLHLFPFPSPSPISPPSMAAKYHRTSPLSRYLIHPHPFSHPRNNAIHRLYKFASCQLIELVANCNKPL